MEAFRKPLELDTGKGILTIHSTFDFDFALKGRSHPSMVKIHELMNKSYKTLEAIESENAATEATIMEILTKYKDVPDTFIIALRTLKSSAFYIDNNWRSLMQALFEKDNSYIPLMRVALLSYIQYLRICNRTSSLLRTYYTLPQSTRKKGTITSHMAPNVSEDFFTGYKRLTRNTPVTVLYEGKNPLELKLSIHSCRLITGETWQFVDPQDISYQVKIGRYIIGRDTLNDIIIDETLTDISRVHLVIQRLDDKTVRLLDVSSHGTYLPSELLD